MFCENCGAQTSEEANVCEECGHTLNPTGITVSNQMVSYEEESGLVPIKNVRKKKLGIVGGAAAVILVLAVILVSVLNGAGDKGAPLLYVKDGGLYALKDNAKEPYIISYDVSSGGSLGGDYHNGVYVTEDGTNMFYVDSKDPGNSTFDIYMRDPREEKPSGKNADDKGIRLASNVSLSSTNQPFKIVEDGKYVFYYKDTDDAGRGKLYFNDLKEEVRLDYDVDGFIYGDGVVFYQKNSSDSGNTLYVCELKPDADKQKIGDDIAEYRIQGKTAYYSIYDSSSGTKSFYMKEFGKDKVKIDEGRIDALYLMGNGSIYFTKMSENDGSLYNYVEDDMLAQDEQVTQPDMADYQTEEYVDGFFSYYRTVTDYDSYYAARDAYFEKADRDSLRMSLQTENPFGALYSLYKVEKGKAVLECETVSNLRVLKGKDGLKGWAYVQKTMDSSGPVVKLSELEDISDIYGYFDEDITSDLCVLMEGGKSSVIQKDTKMNNGAVYLAGDTVVYLDSNEDSLYIAQVSDKNVGTLKSLDYDVYSVVTDRSDSTFHYYKDMDDKRSGDLYEYKDGKSKRIATDVHINSAQFLGNTSDFVYLSDYSEYSAEGTAYLVKAGKEKVRIADDVCKLYYINDSIYFLQDYNMDSDRADLKKFVKEGSTELIDEGVSFVII